MITVTITRRLIVRLGIVVGVVYACLGLVLWRVMSRYRDLPNIGSRKVADRSRSATADRLVAGNTVHASEKVQQSVLWRHTAAAESSDWRTIDSTDRRRGPIDLPVGPRRRFVVAGSLAASGLILALATQSAMNASVLASLWIPGYVLGIGLACAGFFVAAPYVATVPRVMTVRRAITANGMAKGGAGSVLALSLSRAALILNERTPGEQPVSTAVVAIIWLVALSVLPITFLTNQRLPADPLQLRCTRGPRSRLVVVAILLLIVVVAAFFRLYQLADIPTYMDGDEGQIGLGAYAALTGPPIPLFGTGWFGFSNLAFMYYAPGIMLYGTTILGVRFMAALAGILTVGVFYLLAREIVSTTAALVVSALFAVAHVAVQFSRWGLFNVHTMLATVLVLYFFLRWLRRGGVLDLVWCGYAVAYGIYFYTGGWALPLIVAAMFLHQLLLRPGGWRALTLSAGASAVAFVIAYLPQVPAEWAIRNDIVTGTVGRSALAHRAGYFAGNPQLHSDLDIIVQQARRDFELFTMGGNSPYDVPGVPGIDTTSAVLFLLGLAFATLSIRHPTRFKVAMTFWIVFVVGGVFTLGAPYWPRLVGLIPCIFILAGISLEQFISIARLLDPKKAAYAIGPLLVLVCLVNIYTNYDAYFHRVFQAQPRSLTMQLFEDLQAAVPGDQAYSSDKTGLPAGHAPFHYLASKLVYGGAPTVTELIVASEKIDREAVFILASSDQPGIQQLRSCFPDAMPLDLPVIREGMPVVVLRVNRVELQHPECSLAINQTH